MIDKIKAYGWMALSVAALSLLAVQTWRLHTAQLDTATAVTTLANERAIASEARSTQNTDFRKTEIALSNFDSQTRKNTNEQVRIVAAQRDTLLNRVRIAEASAKSGGLSCSTTTSDDGASTSRRDKPELLAQIGTADVLEAERADVIRLHLEACYTQYNRAQEALKEFNK